MDTTDILGQFEYLREQLRTGKILFSELKSALYFHDALGQRWRLDLRGQWHRYEGQREVLAQPPSTLKPEIPDLWKSLLEPYFKALEGCEETDSPAAIPDSEPSCSPPVRRPQQGRLHKLWPVAGGILILLIMVVVLKLWSDTFPKPTTVPTEIPSVIAVETATNVVARPSPTNTIRPTPPSVNPTSRNTPSPTPSLTPKAKSTRTPTPTHTQTVTASPTETNAPTSTSAPSATRTPTCTATQTATATAAPTIEPSGQIIFPVFDGTRQEINIYVADVFGGGRRLLLLNASQPGVDQSLYRFTYRSWESEKRGLFVHRISSGPQFSFSEDPWHVTQYFEAARLALSWDGQNVVYPSKQGSDHKWRVYDVNTEALPRGSEDMVASAPAWLPDGRLVFNHCHAHTCGLYMMYPDGRGLKQLTSSPHDTNPEVSPDGMNIAFMSQQDGSYDIYVVGVSGGDPKRLTHHSAQDALPVWSPDGRWIAFVSNRDGPWAVWAMAKDGAKTKRLFYLEGMPGGCPPHVMEHECGGWPEERLVWIP